MSKTKSEVDVLREKLAKAQQWGAEAASSPAQQKAAAMYMHWLGTLLVRAEKVEVIDAEIIDQHLQLVDFIIEMRKEAPEVVVPKELYEFLGVEE